MVVHFVASINYDGEIFRTMEKKGQYGVYVLIFEIWLRKGGIYVEIIFSEYLISTDKSKLNVDVIHKFLSRSYWANLRPIETIIKSIDHSSLCFGVYHGVRQIGFARIVTDRATMYWLDDVFIDEEYRGKGIGKRLIATIVNYDELQALNGMLLTADAHGLYEQFGFAVNSKKAMIRKAK